MTKLMQTLVAGALLAGSAVIAADNMEAYRHGAWETLVQATRKSDDISLREMDLQIPNSGSAHVRYSMNAANGSLVLILSGTFATADNPYSNDLGRELMNAGYGVVEMDSFVSTRFVTQMRQGAPGNLRHEALLAGQVLQELIRRTGNKVSDISVTGVSYGGAVALQMALLDKAGQLPIKLAHVVSFSAPVSFRETMQRLDDYEDLPYSYDTIVPIVKSAKPNSGVPSGTSTEQLEKVIGRGFRLDLAKAVDTIDRLYASQIHPSPAVALGLENLGDPSAPRMEREVESSAIPFRTLFRYWLAPYWIGKGGIKSESDLLNYGEMSAVLPELGSNVEVVLTRNDPLNAPGATSELEKIQTAAHVTVLPTGGHAGFVRTEQGKSIVNRIFSKTVAVATVERKE